MRSRLVVVAAGLALGGCSADNNLALLKQLSVDPANICTTLMTNVPPTYNGTFFICRFNSCGSATINANGTFTMTDNTGTTACPSKAPSAVPTVAPPPVPLPAVPSIPIA